MQSVKCNGEEEEEEEEEEQEEEEEDSVKTLKRRLILHILPRVSG